MAASSSTRLFALAAAGVAGVSALVYNSLRKKKRGAVTACEDGDGCCAAAGGGAAAWDSFREIRLSNEKQVQQQVNRAGEAFPLVLAATAPEGEEADDEKKKAATDLWSSRVEKQRGQLLDALGRHGALLLRGLPLSTAEDFLGVLNAFKFEFGSYIGGGGPRGVVLGPIHNSTFTPSHLRIQPHHELAYLTDTPGKLIFFCETPPKENGETPILDSNRYLEALRAMHPRFVAECEAKGVIYTRVMADESTCDGKLQRSWQESFETKDREEATRLAKKVGAATVTFDEESGAMTIVSRPLDAVRKDPRTGRSTWFNSVVLLHPAAQVTLKKAEEGKAEADKTVIPWNVQFGDGSEMPDQVIVDAQKLMWDEAVMFKWQRGDVLVVDNYLALHARNYFTAPRLILAAIAK